jgi:amino acid permease
MTHKLHHHACQLASSPTQCINPFVTCNASAAGAGVLGLPASLAWLGWVGGLLALVFFFAVSLWAALMLTEVYMVRSGLQGLGCQVGMYIILDDS